MAGNLADLPDKRARNLRQRLLQASRQVNISIVKALNNLGFDEFRSTHTALLSNLSLDGASLTTVARNAGMTKQAMGRLAEDLMRLGYIRSTPDKADRRAVHFVGFHESDPPFHDVDPPGSPSHSRPPKSQFHGGSVWEPLNRFFR